MNRKLSIAGIALLAAGTTGLIFAGVLEIISGEPVYYLVMKVAAGFFGVGGPLLGWGLVKRGKRK